MPSPSQFLALGAVFHLLFCYSIFDIYFTSPLVHGMQPVDPKRELHVEPPAKRLMLIIGDGLRTDKLFENSMERAPFLKSLITSHQASWGISHTRVPTESRPGHVAIIGGFYEDVSAVTRGWQENPVEFDSLFNESRWTWSFGSPDILPMFARGASEKDKVAMFMYEGHEEDFSKEASWLDIWVFEKFQQLLKNATIDEELNQRLRSDSIVIFLHLLGIDTNGHAFRPNSPEYLENIRLVDNGVKTVVKLVSDFFKDDKTAFLFTADHGMHNRGSHGDGHPDNTLTPLIAWGAGISTTVSTDDTDQLSKDWNMDKWPRMDVEQADIAPLMSTLIGVPPPMNSVGRLPTKYLDSGLGPRFKAKSAEIVARQVSRQYLVKEQFKMHTEIWFKPFPELGIMKHASPSQEKLEALFSQVENAIEGENWQLAEQLCVEIEAKCLRGLRYYQTYDRIFLRILVSLGYLGWIFYSTVFVVEAYSGIHGGLKSEYNWSSSPLQIVTFTSLATLLLIKHSPIMYYVYAAFPVYFWGEVWKQWPIMKPHLQQWITKGTGSSWILGLIGVVLCLELLTFSYFDRRIFSLLCTLYALTWTMIMPKKIWQRDGLLVASWIVSCIAVGSFTWLPVDLHEHVWMINLATLGMLSVSLWVLFNASSLKVTEKESSVDTVRIIGFQTLLLSVATLLVNDSSQRLRSKQGLPSFNQASAWILSIVSTSIPFFTQRYPSLHRHWLLRLFSIFLAFATPFTLLTVSYESLFYLVYSIMLFTWLLVERRCFELESMGEQHEPDVTKSSTPSGLHRHLKLGDLRTSLFFLTFLNLAFFGTGNVASVASFTVESVTRFQTVFSPFLMGALLVFKILIPFLILSSFYSVLSRAVDLPPFALFLLTVTTTDVMTLNFFYMVRDTGAWLDIGESISHFVIASGLSVFSMILFWISHKIVGQVLIPKQVKNE